MKLFVFDLDGTIADCRHRLDYIICNPEFGSPKMFRPNWPGFFEACDKDKPIKWVIDIMQLLNESSQHAILILSARSEAVRQKTVDWLKLHDVPCDFLEMRPEGDCTPDEIIKLRMLNNFMSENEGLELQFIVDDRQKVVDMWRRNGFNVLQCAAWKETK